MAQQIQVRRGTATEWTTANPTLAQGEIGFETTTGKFKIGTGLVAWNSLAYTTSLGPTGPAGTNGTAGPTGPAGSNGSAGTAGPTGPAGSVGPTGPAGSGGGGGGTWGTITGTLTSQTDLNGALHVDSAYVTANAMSGTVIDTSKQMNTKSVAADTTFTFSGVPPNANTFFDLVLANTDTAEKLITIPSSYSIAQQATITSFYLPATSVVELSWRYDGAVYRLSGEPVRQFDSISWTFIGTTTARDYPVTLKTGYGFVITNIVTKCESGSATATGKIDGVAMGGTPNAVSTTEDDKTHATANLLDVGQDLSIGFTAGAVDPRVTFSGYRTA